MQLTITFIAHEITHKKEGQTLSVLIAPNWKLIKIYAISTTATLSKYGEEKQRRMWKE